MSEPYDEGFQQLGTAYVGRGEIVVTGTPPQDEDEEMGHNCDAMGCGSCHVMYRAPFPTPTPARSEAAGGEERAIADLQFFRQSHVDWAEHFEKNPELAAQYVATGEWDDAGEHRRIVEAYDNALAVITSLRQQLAAAREDGERLDWMQEHYAEIGWLVPNSDPAVCEVWETHEGVRVVASWSASGDGPDLRSAIDAARSEPSGEGETCGTMPPVRVTPIRRGKPMPYDVPDDEPGGEDSQC
ncbi:MAG TPA: hypothetical protein VFT57_15790 [Gemmatimonadaceae bacterium]|nr:hypothetical protein [Gemmatimonadaceae bacterium]